MAEQQEQLDYIRPLVLALFRKDTLEDDDRAMEAIRILHPGTKLELLHQMVVGRWKFGDDGVEFARRMLERPGLIPDRTGQVPLAQYRNRFVALLKARKDRAQFGLDPVAADYLAYVAYDTSKGRKRPSRC